MFKKLLCLNQFGKLSAYYISFPLGIDKDSSFEAVLYIKSNDRIKQISKEKYLKIVKSLKDYYSIWYKRFMTDEEYSNYSLLINEIYAKIIDNQAPGDFITISYIDCPLLTPGERTHAILMPQSNTPKKKKWLIPFGVLGIVVIASIIAALCGFIFKKCGIDISSISIIIANVASALISAFFLWFIGKKS